MPYSKEISRRNPSAIMFLLDQSGSMSEGFGAASIPKAQGAADAINRLLQELILKCTKEEGIRDYFDVAIIGYGSQQGYAGALIGQKFVKLSWLGEHPNKIEERTRKESDGAGGIVENRVKFPIWFDPVASGDTPMCKALELAYEWVSEWITDHQDAYPPMIFNITDGGATDADPESAAKKIMSLSTSDGNVLIYNCHISGTKGSEILFPKSEEELPADELARKLFRMSSLLPQEVINLAEKEIAVEQNSRGFAFNADLVNLIKFLNIGTRTPELQ
jgi:hypothetical protein